MPRCNALSNQFVLNCNALFGDRSMTAPSHKQTRLCSSQANVDAAANRFAMNIKSVHVEDPEDEEAASAEVASSPAMGKHMDILGMRS